MCLLAARFNQVDAVKQRSIHCVGRPVRKIRETVEAAEPVAFLLQVTVVAAITGCVEKALVRTVFEVDSVQNR